MSCLVRINEESVRSMDEVKKVRLLQVKLARPFVKSIRGKSAKSEKFYAKSRSIFESKRQKKHWKNKK